MGKLQFPKTIVPIFPVFYIRQREITSHSLFGSPCTQQATCEPFADFLMFSLMFSRFFIVYSFLCFFLHIFFKFSQVFVGSYNNFMTFTLTEITPSMDGCSNVSYKCIGIEYGLDLRMG